MKSTLHRSAPPKSALVAKSSVSRHLLMDNGVQSVGLRQDQDGNWHILVTLLQGAVPPADLPKTVDGYGVEIGEGDQITPLTSFE